jgi:hypothetical protein
MHTFVGIGDLLHKAVVAVLLLSPCRASTVQKVPMGVARSDCVSDCIHDCISDDADLHVCVSTVKTLLGVPN